MLLNKFLEQTKIFLSELQKAALVIINLSIYLSKICFFRRSKNRIRKWNIE